MNYMAMYGYHMEEKGSRAFARLISMDADSEFLTSSCAKVGNGRVGGDGDNVPKLQRLLKITPCIVMESSRVSFKYSSNTLGELLIKESPNLSKLTDERKNAFIVEFEKGMHDILILLINVCGTDRECWRKESPEYILDVFRKIFPKGPATRTNRISEEMEFMFEVLWSAAEGLFFGCTFAKECWPKWGDAVANESMRWLGRASSASKLEGTYFSAGYSA